MHFNKILKASVHHLAQMRTGTRGAKSMVPVVALLKYAEYESAGDALVGRILSLLPPQSPRFSTLPPHFSPSTPQSTVNAIVCTCFGSVCGDGPRRAAPFLAATLIYHWEYLRQALPKEHSFFKSTFGLLDARAIAGYRKLVTIDNDHPTLQPTGIPGMYAKSSSVCS